MWTFIVVFILLTAGYSAQTYDNSVGGNLYRCCPSKQVVSQIKSSHSSYDRQWKVECKPFDAALSCSWSGFFNLYEKELNYNCPANHVIAGVRSNYEHAHRDRKWSILCCTAPKLITFECRETPMVNYWNEDFDWCVPGDNFLTGIQTRDRNNHGSEKIRINDAISEFHLSTCVRFVPHKGQTNYIGIVKATGCWSLVGRSKGYQQLSLGSGCISNGIIQHELIHALGFWHEQSRTDRDIYVKINFENIKDGKEGNFKQRETNNLNVPYDYTSVMHYGPRAFSKNGRDTITPLRPSAVIGQRIGMSENDILKINKLYGCKDYLHKNGEWDNELGGVLSRQCPSGQALSGITSVHNDGKNDRLWAISCKAFKERGTCRLSDYANSYCAGMDFKCADNEVIAGAYSVHHSYYQDRRWRFYCCRVPGFVLFNCKEEPKINYWKENFSWAVPSSNFLTGVKSDFDIPTRGSGILRISMEAESGISEWLTSWPCTRSILLRMGVKSERLNVNVIWVQP
ncbi:uncharacterized protein AKAME5_001858100 [Lates japonicus]|uniref:Metalloendopeptidase n=1 Tax=Lates japonicus TaxID=270547 RepID=A0AAD3N7L8_LATJO|nr:uncharacterized protein AKAME5_001858100 [Lates japonicus]